MALSIRRMAAELGVSKSQVARDAQAGMPMTDAAAARLWRAAQHDMSRTVEGRVDRPAAPPVQPPAAPPSADDDPAAADDEDTAAYRAARANRERINAERAQLELDQLRGRLVDRDEVARLRFTEFRSLRDGLGNIGARIKDACAVETDPLRCEILINDAVGEVLNAFADQVLTRGVTQDDDDEPD